MHSLSTDTIFIVYALQGRFTMFQCFYFNGEFFGNFKTLKYAKKVCGEYGVGIIISTRASRIYYLGTDF